MFLCRTCLAGILLLMRLMVMAQAESPIPARVDEPYQGAFKAEAEQREADLWKQLSEKDPTNVDAQYGWFVSSRNASMARNQGELPDSDRKQLETIADNLEKNAPNSFEAHMARFHLDFPARAAFNELAAAAAIDAGRSELLGPQLAKALLDGGDGAITAACKALDDRGGISAALLEVAGDLLLSIDREGIVFTNGEMDTYPTLVKQRVFGIRKDVLVIDQRLLGDAGYRQRSWSQARAAGQPPATVQAFIKSLLNATTRPVFLALSLEPDLARSMESELFATGIALRYSHQRVDNIPLLEERWKQMRRNLYAGPLSANYLLPGIVLLKHYRSTGNEEQAAMMEHQVRAMAEALGQTARLYRIGVLEH